MAVDYTGLNSRDFFPRLRQERGAGLYAWDLRIGGTDTLGFDAKADGMMEPVRPRLMLPEVTRSDAWLQGLDGRFSDNDGSYIFAFIAYANPAVFVNRDFIPEADLQSIEQLTDPRWKGRIVLQDPRGGSGLLTLSAFLKAYGEGFVRDLLVNQEPVVTSDNRQQAEWLTRGRYPIGVGVDNTQLGDFQAQGVGTNVKPLLRGVKRLTSGFGTIQLIDKQPHPNASTLFINWLLTPAVQARVAEASHLNSARLDVAMGNPETAVDRSNLDQYLDINREEYRSLLEQAERLSRELVK
jgi:iron(III) transport system substrate-binding protein